MARELQREDGYIIVLRAASYPSLAWSSLALEEMYVISIYILYNIYLY